MATFAQTAPELAATAQPRASSDALNAFCLALGVRLFYSILGAYFAPKLRLDPALIHSNSATGNLIDRGLHPVLYALLGIWERFDTLWYLHIARAGYDSAMSTVFYPIYPALIRVVSILTRSDLASSLVVSTLASFFLFWGALRLFTLDYKPAVRWRALVLWVVWPASFTLFAGYPDSLLCALIVWAIFFARRQQWLPAGVLGMFAGLTKALGCVVALPVLFLAFRTRKPAGFLAGAMCGLGTAGFQLWLAMKSFPSPASVYATYWHTSTVAPWSTLLDSFAGLARGGDLLLILNFLALALTTGVALWRDVRPEYRIFTVAAVCIFLTKHTQPLLQSTMRYCVGIFAAFPSLAARFDSNWLLAAAALFCAALNLLLFRVFLDWGLVV